jgi:mono/diheme cytochrome c family protein
MRSTSLTAICLLLIFAAQSARVLRGAQNTQTRSADARPADTQLARGRYLVEEVAKCSECHTPRDADMQLERAQWLQGAPIWIQPSRHIENWAQFAPSLAGLPGYSDEQMGRVLEMGQAANGRAIQPPMHVYHLNHADAQAVVAYLRSLPTPTAR